MNERSASNGNELERMQARINDLIKANELLTRELSERRLSEEALALSELNARTVLDGIPGLVAILTPLGEVQHGNKQILDYCGEPLERLKDWASNGIVHPDDLPHVSEIFAAAISTGTDYVIEQRLRRFDGTYRWFGNRGIPSRDHDGSIICWYVLLIDIDDRKHAQDALLERERNLRTIIDGIPGFVAVASAEGELRIANKQMTEYFGAGVEQLRPWGDWVHEDDLQRASAELGASIESGDTFEVEHRLRRADGTYRWFSSRGQPVRNASGQIDSWCFLITDNHDRKRAEAAVKDAYDHLSEAQRLSQTGSFEADIAVDSHTWSDQLYRIFEITPGTPISVQTVRNVIHPGDLLSFDTGFQKSLTDGSGFELTFRITAPSGRRKYLHASGHVTSHQPGRPLFMGAIQDVTRQKVVEEELAQARSELAHVTRVTTLSVLTASIAHEINQPLSGIINNASTCLRLLDNAKPDLEGALRTTRRTIRDGNRAAEIVKRLRALFSKREFAADFIDVNEMLHEVIALSGQELQRRHVILATEFEPGIPQITGDRVQLQQVVFNLLLNACDAMTEINDRPRQLFIQTVCENASEVCVAVKDTGQGAPPDQFNKLFEAFYTTKPDGMGVGLSVSRAIIERHSGRLWAARNEGPGLTFSFSIPCNAVSDLGA